MSDAPGDLILVEDGFRTIRDVRLHIDESTRLGLPLETDRVLDLVERRRRELNDPGVDVGRLDTLMP